MSQKRIARRLLVLGLRGFRPRGWVRTTTPDPTMVPAPNTLARDFTVGVPDRVWSADITYLPTHDGFLYLAVVLDVGSRRVVGWVMRPTRRRSWWWPRWMRPSRPAAVGPHSATPTGAVNTPAARTGSGSRRTASRAA